MLPKYAFDKNAARLKIRDAPIRKFWPITDNSLTLEAKTDIGRYTVLKY